MGVEVIDRTEQDQFIALRYPTPAKCVDDYKTIRDLIRESKFSAGTIRIRRFIDDESYIIVRFSNMYQQEVQSILGKFEFNGEEVKLPKPLLEALTIMG